MSKAMGLCKKCGDLFRKKKPSQVFCSRKCQLVGRLQRHPIQKVCPTCNSCFLAGGARNKGLAHKDAVYCSRRCRSFKDSAPALEFEAVIVEKHKHGSRVAALAREFNVPESAIEGIVRLNKRREDAALIATLFEAHEDPSVIKDPDVIADIFNQTAEGCSFSDMKAGVITTHEPIKLRA